MGNSIHFYRRTSKFTVCPTSLLTPLGLLGGVLSFEIFLCLLAPNLPTSITLTYVYILTFYHPSSNTISIRFSIMNMNTYILLMASIASIFSMVAAVDDQPQPRCLRLANDADNTNQLKLNGRILQTSTMSMATESINNTGGITWRLLMPSYQSLRRRVKQSIQCWLNY